MIDEFGFLIMTHSRTRNLQIGKNRKAYPSERLCYEKCGAF